MKLTSNQQYYVRGEKNDYGFGLNSQIQSICKFYSGDVAQAGKSKAELMLRLMKKTENLEHFDLLLSINLLEQFIALM